MLRFGVSFLPDCTASSKPPADYFSDALDLSQLADSGGLDLVKMTQHWLNPYGGYCPSPLTFLSAVAARTKQIRLMTGGLLPVFHHPIQLAAETAMVDAMSGGRLDVGFARAYMPYEFEAFQVPMDGSTERYRATIEAIIRLWTEEKVDCTTPFFSFEGATSQPRPVQQPHPPVWGAAVGSPDSFAWLGQRGFNLLMTPAVPAKSRVLVNTYRNEYLKHHPGVASTAVALSLPVFVHQSSSQAKLLGDQFLERYLEVWSDAANIWNDVSSTDYVGYTGMGAALSSLTAEAMRTIGTAIVGSPNEVVDGIQNLQEQLGFDVLLCQVDFGAMPGHVAESSLRLLIEEVVPSFR